MITLKSKLISYLLVAAILLQTACGYVLHPERRNQHSKGELDFAIVGLDAIGLLFFIVPGLIAFTVDVSTNTIYLPPKFTSNFNPDNSVAIKFEGKLTQAKLEEILKSHFNQNIKIDETSLIFNSKAQSIKL